MQEICFLPEKFCFPPAGGEDSCPFCVALGQLLLCCLKNRLQARSSGIEYVQIRLVCPSCGCDSVQLNLSQFTTQEQSETINILMSYLRGIMGKKKNSKSISFPPGLKPGAFHPLPVLLPELFSLLNLRTVIWLFSAFVCQK